MNRRRLLFIVIAALAVGSLVSLKVYRICERKVGRRRFLQMSWWRLTIFQSARRLRIVSGAPPTAWRSWLPLLLMLKLTSPPSGRGCPIRLPLPLIKGGDLADEVGA